VENERNFILLVCFPTHSTKHSLNFSNIPPGPSPSITYSLF